jgi:hypothetical protein
MTLETLTLYRYFPVVVKQNGGGMFVDKYASYMGIFWWAGEERRVRCK